ncbi:MAG: ATP-grasp domain-containing protein [Methylophilus sp.]|uniref:ATP-grasp domain-containing protein n=1 Tax=Methylophilus sp. TaxID=29541 RepID=UPI002C319A23|nr:ATP-grasp domain-containing protein [Methylophilus sp.]HSH86836.1 ATP-grasp domain-containing protein [Methylophilus sp.]
MQNKSRLKIWVCEYVSAGGLASEALPASLLQEGLLMRDALLADLSELNVDCITSHDARVMPPVSISSVAIQPADDVFALWRKQLAANDIDACWVIAPETDGILERMYQLVQEAGKRWIGCSADAIRKTTSKSMMTNICDQAEISVIPCRYLKVLMPLPSLPFYGDSTAGWVVKPDDGAGCEFTYYFKNDSEVNEFNNKIKNNHSVPYEQLLLQPYIAGQALSMSVLSTKDQVKVIAGHQQRITINQGRFGFEGAGVNEAAQYLPLMQVLAERVKKAIPGLIGYWGADMILTDNNALTLVEINPRLTTPYIQLSKLLTENPAKSILDAVLYNRLSAYAAQSSVSLVLPSVEGEFDAESDAGSNESFAV